MMDTDLFKNYDYEKEYNCSCYTKSNHFSKLMYLIVNKSSIEIIKDYVINNPGEINKTNAKGWSALMMATRYSNTDSNIETVKLLLENGADINLQNNYGSTALMMAAGYSDIDSNIETVKLLLENGADINSRNYFGDTALMFAAHYSHTDSNVETVKLLLEYGTDLKGSDEQLLFRRIKPDSEFGIVCQKIINQRKQAKLSMDQVLSTIKMHSLELLYHPDSWRVNLVNVIKQNINKKSFSELKTEYNWMFNYLGINDDDIMRIKILDNYKFMD